MVERSGQRASGHPANEVSPVMVADDSVAEGHIISRHIQNLMRLKIRNERSGIIAALGPRNALRSLHASRRAACDQEGCNTSGMNLYLEEQSSNMGP